jgi:riboflavin transporter FmnP
LAGTTILAALVVVFDYTVKYSNLKIPFPLLPFLKFDFTGIPIALAMLIFGLIPSFFTSIVALIAILARSGDMVGASMKAIAEFSTIAGMAIGLKITKKFRPAIMFSMGLIIRVLVMIPVNLLLIFIGLMKVQGILAIMVLLIGVFNILQGTITIFGGYSLYEIIKRHVPSIPKDAR